MSRAWASKAVLDIDAEIAELRRLREQIARFAGMAIDGAPVSAAPAAPVTGLRKSVNRPGTAPVGKPRAKAARPSSGKAKGKQPRGASTANEAGPCAYDPKIKGREHYAEVLRKLEEPCHREELLKGALQPSTRSRALNKMAEHGLILVEDGFVRITEAGELYLADAGA